MSIERQPAASAMGPETGGLPTGTVTFLFTDIEGSTRLIQELGSAYTELLLAQRDAIRGSVEREGGHVFGAEGDAVFAAFPDASSALVAASDAQRALADHPWPADHPIRVRMGIHTGEATLAGGDYVGLALHQAARITSAGHGGQVLVSGTTRDLAGSALGGLELRDLGEHRLKDLARAERIFELVVPGLDRTFPALKTLDAGPNNLPVQLTSFIGRAELEPARRLLASHRLLTLTGPGGTGKTRLALQLAADMVDDYPGGVFFVPLETITDPDLIPSAVIEAIGMDPGTGPPFERLVDHLRGRRTLVVLDNFEQVDDGAAMVVGLLSGAPDLTLIVTSRVVLRATGEQEFPVPPLQLPKTSDRVTAREAAGIEAVRLFVERAMAADPGFTLTDANAAAVTDIVVRLDGLPLAIELAAARVRILPVDALRARLDDRLGVLTGGARDRPERQRTLRGAIDWSHDLLDEPDRRLFRRFAVFAGGACLSQVEAVCGPTSELGRDALDGLASLAEKSLIRPVPGGPGEPRFAMLATIREYALERLSDAAEADELRGRHASTYVGLVEGYAAELTGPTGPHRLDRLELDHDNLRAAADWAVAGGHADVALRLLAAIWRFWQIRGHLQEAEARSREILGLAGCDDQPAALRARALGAAGSITYWRGDYPATHRNYQAALAAAREAGDPAILADALYNAAFAQTPEVPANAFELSAEPVSEALAIYRELGDERGIANTNWALGLDAMARQDWIAGRGFIEESLRAYRALDDPFGTGWALHELALIDAKTGSLETAEDEARQALAIFGRAGDLSAAVLLLLDLVFVAHLRGQPERMWRLAGAADTVRRVSGADLVAVTPWLEWEVPARPVKDPAALALWDGGAALTPQAAIAEALDDGPA